MYLWAVVFRVWRVTLFSNYTDTNVEFQLRQYLWDDRSSSRTKYQKMAIPNILKNIGKNINYQIPYVAGRQNNKST